MTQYKTLAELEEATVMAQYTPLPKTHTSYQSEADLEAALLEQLQGMGYEYLSIHSEPELIANLRKQLETLNRITFTDGEWERFFLSSIAGQGEGIIEKTNRIQRDWIQSMKRDDGTVFNVYLIDKDCIHNNKLQVINQYEQQDGKHEVRYDVTILVNGLPLVHIELKRRGVALRQAFNQINRYRRDSFWAGSGLFEYIQIFIISNGTYTKYYSNTTREGCVNENLSNKKTGSSFSFTSYWADATNRIIPDLEDFTRTFLYKHVLLNVLTRYCVFTTENSLMVMRPYQIAATEKILNRIEIANNYRKYGTKDGGGYIWHTTGSGKTLTSFKTAQLATKLPYIDKVLFVVDRRDLDYQTMKEYDRFEKGSVNGNNNTAQLKKQLENDSVRIIVTTIQKLSIFISRNPRHPVYGKHVVIIFDECHRSQFGDMHRAIIRAFKKYHLFGFTGTPIFAVNAVKSGKSKEKTTPDLFGGLPNKEGKEILALHTYTIVDAIRDDNVLPFRIDFVNTVKLRENIKDAKVSAINKESALLAPERIRSVVEYVLEQFDRKTKRGKTSYTVKGKRLTGFNSMFAVASIDAAMAYYEEFKRQLKASGRKLNVATIFTYLPDEKDTEEDVNGTLDEETLETEGMPKQSRDFLDAAIRDYNAVFKTNFSTEGQEFENYYKDLSQRMKNGEVDLLIVVNMFLTGFDAKCLNTLWVDKNLRMHGLIQAFSRTNRILNSVKSFGNIVSFRNLGKATDEALSIFGDPNAGSVVIMKSFSDYFYGWTDDEGVCHTGYKDLAEKLLTEFLPGQMPETEQLKKDFITLFGTILRLRNILSTFDEFDAVDPLPIGGLIQDYQSTYVDLRSEHRRDGNSEDIVDDVVFEVELVKQLEVNIDYILALVAKYHESNCKDEEIKTDIRRAMDASLQLRSKKELIESFLARLNEVSDVYGDWRTFVLERMEIDLMEIIQTESLDEDKTRAYMGMVFRNGELKTTGTEIGGLLPPMSRFGGKRAAKKQKVLDLLGSYFERYRDIL